jgi:hypothetical protein
MNHVRNMPQRLYQDTARLAPLPFPTFSARQTLTLRTHLSVITHHPAHGGSDEHNQALCWALHPLCKEYAFIGGSECTPTS